MEAAAVPHHQTALVEVSLTFTDEAGHETTATKSIPGGPTDVDELKRELEVVADRVLWLVEKHGKKRQLADHQRHNVKEGDHFEVVGRGGVS